MKAMGLSVHWQICRAKAGKVTVTLHENASLLPPLLINNAATDSLLLISSSGYLSIIKLADLPI